MEALGFEVDAYDIINGAQFDIADDAVWDPLHAQLRAGQFSAAMISPPCGTFSRLRNAPGGPPPLRGTTGASRYGLLGLDKTSADLVRLHNI